MATEQRASSYIILLLINKSAWAPVGPCTGPSESWNRRVVQRRVVGLETRTLGTVVCHVYIMFGNSYDTNGLPDSAITLYWRG